MKQFFVVAILAIFIMSCVKKVTTAQPYRANGFLKNELTQEYKNGTLTDMSTYQFQGNPYYDFEGNNTVKVYDGNNPEYNETYTYSSDAKKLTTTDGYIVTNFDVTTLTSSALALQYAISDTMNATITKDLMTINLTRLSL